MLGAIMHLESVNGQTKLLIYAIKLAPSLLIYGLNVLVYLHNLCDDNCHYNSSLDYCFEVGICDYEITAILVRISQK